jgi:hypothetical protein
MKAVELCILTPIIELLMNIEIVLVINSLRVRLRIGTFISILELQVTDLLVDILQDL